MQDFVVPFVHVIPDIDKRRNLLATLVLAVNDIPDIIAQRRNLLDDYKPKTTLSPASDMFANKKKGIC